MLIGHADAVDMAIRRIAMKGTATELTRLAEERQADRGFWASGSAGIIGPEAVSGGVKRFSLTVSIRNGLTSDLALEFNGAPSENTLQMWQATLGAATREGDTVRFRMSVENDEVQQNLSKM